MTFLPKPRANRNRRGITIVPVLGDLVAMARLLRDREAAWWAKVLVLGVIAYVVSPIDLIPDFIPVVGYLDDLILVPLGI